ncbi:MAG: cupin domain-containing protein [Thermoleophilia bacterium]|nr:cupin domain-containing protein [Thermoleophilia bacterium]
MTRVTTDATTAATQRGEGVEDVALVPEQDGSELTLHTLRLGSAAVATVGADEADTLLFAVEGSGTLSLDNEHHALARGTAAHVPAGGRAELHSGPEGLTCLAMTVGADVDLHAPLGTTEPVVQLHEVEPGKATGSRSFQVLYGPHNGSTRATLFVGYIPPGRAPWHYHLYDEIVWVFRGSGALHLGDVVEELAEGSAFRLAPREVHIVENRQEHAELAVLGLFTPAGSPSAAYLPPDVAGTYAFAGTD